MTNTIKVGAIINDLTWFGRVSKAAIELAVQDINNSSLLGNRKLMVYVNDSRGDSIEAASLARWLMEREVITIVGPNSSEEAVFVAKLCQASSMPMISYSATDPSISSRTNPFFLRLPHSDAVQAKILASLIINYKWRNVVIIYVDDDYGLGIQSPLSEFLENNNSHVGNRFAISLGATEQDIREVLWRVKSMQGRVFIVHMTSELGARLFAQAKSMDMMEKGYVWIVTEGLATELDVLEPQVMKNMKGVLAIKTFIDAKENLSFARRWRDIYILQNPEDINRASLNIYGYFVYDSIWMIALALKEIGLQKFGFTPNNNGLSSFSQGDRLKDAISEIAFKGISGYVNISKGKDIGYPYEILNVNGMGYRVIGLVEVSGKNAGSLSRLSQVVWPGNTSSLPKGFVESTEEKKFRIVVPLRREYKEFISSQKRIDGQGFDITGGFVIDVFKLALQYLPYAFPYEFVPVGDGKITPDYTNITLDVYNKMYDAAVGDFTITKNRSEYIDFTQAFLESGLAMVVQVKRAEVGNFFVFLEPFSIYLWLAVGFLSLLTALLIWFLEHKYNEAFRGKTAEQFVNSLWFTFSTLYFVHREKVETSLGRILMVFWLFLVLILTSSYTASLTSVLTVQDMEPKVKSLDALKASRGNVGYPNGSFVDVYLLNQLEIEAERLKSYASEKEFDAAFRNGSIDALFLELPYVRVFLSHYCGYQVVSPTYGTGGFGFVFPKNSPMVADMSKAILEVAESADMQKLENKWFNNTAMDCSNQGPKLERLGINNFWVLYVIAVIPSLFGLVRHCSRSLRQRNEAITSMDRIDAPGMERAITFPTRRSSFVRLKRELPLYGSTSQFQLCVTSAHTPVGMSTGRISSRSAHY